MLCCVCRFCQRMLVIENERSLRRRRGHFLYVFLSQLISIETLFLSIFFKWSKKVKSISSGKKLGRFNIPSLPTKFIELALNLDEIRKINANSSFQSNNRQTFQNCHYDEMPILISIIFFTRNSRILSFISWQEVANRQRKQKSLESLI